ncbi:MAG: hypothetical protein ACJATI_005526 [Halioglobus sp.]|jgi:hypothetical protein
MYRSTSMAILKHTSDLSTLAVQLSVVLLFHFSSARSTFRPLIEDNGSAIRGGFGVSQSDIVIAC